MTLTFARNKAPGAKISASEYDGTIDELARRSRVRLEDFTTTTSVAERFSLAAATAMTEKYALGIEANYTLDGAVPLISVTGSSPMVIAGRGNLHVPTNIAAPLTFVAPYDPPLSVVSILETTHAFPGVSAVPSLCTRIEVSGNPFAIGDLAKLIADNQIPGSTASTKRVGTFLPVGDVSGNYIWCLGTLDDAFTVNPRIVKIPKAPRLIIEGLRMSSVAGAAYNTNFLTVRGFMMPVIDLEVVDGNGVACLLQSTAFARADLTVRNFQNRVSSAAIPGYGMQDSGWRSRVNVDGEGCRHGYTTITYTAGSLDEAWKYGPTDGAVVSGSLAASSAAAWDTHSEARNITFLDCFAERSAHGEDSSGAGVLIRGRGIRHKGGSDKIMLAGSEFYAQVEGGCANNSVENRDYRGNGDALRGGQSNSETINNAVVTGGTWWVKNNIRAAVWGRGDLTMDGQKIYPNNSLSGAGVFAVQTGAKLRIRNVAVDLRDYVGSNFRFANVDAGATNWEITLENCRLDNAAGKVQAWINANSTVGKVVIKNCVCDGTPTNGYVIGGDNLSPAAAIFDNAADIAGKLSGAPEALSAALAALAADADNAATFAEAVTDALVDDLGVEVAATVSARIQRMLSKGDVLEVLGNNILIGTDGTGAQKNYGAVDVYDLISGYLNTAIAAKANLASPTFTGVPVAPTAASGNSTTQLATTAFVTAAVSEAITGLAWKTSVRAAAVTNGTLASAYAAGSVVDGVTLATGDRIALLGQTAAADNGIYVVNATGAPTRAADANSAAEMLNATFSVQEGTLADSQWVCTTNAPITLGTTALSFTRFATYHANLVALAGLTLIADRLPYANGAGTLALTTLTAAGRALIDDADAAAQIGTLKTGLSTLAITGAGNFSIAVLPHHSAITVSLTANSTITAVSGMVVGQSILVEVTNTGSFTLAETATELQLAGADALTVGLGASVRTLLLLVRTSTGYVIRNTGVATS